MNSTTIKRVVGLVLLIFLVFMACCVWLPWWINHLLLARIDGPSFSTDQVIASLGVMVTGLGLFIALAAVGIAVLAAIGYAELRSTVERSVQKETAESEKRLKDEILSLVQKKMFSGDPDEDERVADLVERVESTSTPIESRTTKGTDMLQTTGPTGTAKKDHDHMSGYTCRDGYVPKSDGTSIRGRDGRDYHISENPDAKGDDGTGEDSDGGTSVEPPEVDLIGSAVSTGDVPESESPPRGNLPVSGNVVATGAEPPIAGEYPQGKEDEEL